MNENDFQMTIYFSHKLIYLMIFSIKSLKRISNEKEKGKREKERREVMRKSTYCMLRREEKEKERKIIFFL